VLQAISVGGETVWTTPGHLVWSESRGWIPVEEWQGSDTGRTIQGESATATTSGFGPFNRTVYNVIVAEHHNFFVGEAGLLVHNGCHVNFAFRGKAARLAQQMRDHAVAAGGNLPTFPTQRPAVSAAHHMVAHGDKRAEEAAELLMRAGLTDPDGWWNGVYLPKNTKKSVVDLWKKDPFGHLWPNAAKHAPLHTDKYYDVLTARLKNRVPAHLQNPITDAQRLQLAQILIDELEVIRGKLLTGNFP
jgi:hypothetical protein